VVEGQVRGVQLRTEQQNDLSEAIWSFRVERYDESGNRVQLIPAEMRGYSMEGWISDGDWVRGTGTMKSGTFRMNEAENLTTGARVRPKKTYGIACGVLFIAFIIALIAVAIWVISHAPG
jgi:serine/threonine-protein kinase